MFGLSFTELLVIFGVALIVIGPDKMPELAKNLGRAMNQLKNALDEIKRDVSLPPVINSVQNTMQEIKRDLIAVPRYDQNYHQTPAPPPNPAPDLSANLIGTCEERKVAEELPTGSPAPDITKPTEPPHE